MYWNSKHERYQAWMVDKFIDMVKSYYHAMHVGASLPYQYKINTGLLGWRKTKDKIQVTIL